MIRPVTPRALGFLPGDDLTLYLRDVGKTRILGRKEERELLARARTGDRRALNALIQANLRFVVSVAFNYRNRGLPLGDLINEGNLGLIRAAERFDPSQGVKFISYAVWWIRQGIQAALGKHYRKWEDPAAEDFLDSVSAPAEFAADAETDRRLLRKHTLEAVDSLPGREREVVRRFFGLEDGHVDTLEAIGEDLGLSRERVRQIKDSGLAKLRQPRRIKELLAARDWASVNAGD